MQGKIKINKTGETMTFVRTAPETQGEILEFICDIPAGSEGPPKHKHILQSEIFEVLEGTLIVEAGNQKRTLKPGQKMTIPANTIHTYTTPHDAPVKVRVVMQPALHTEWQFRSIYASCNRHKSEQPNKLEAAYIINTLKDEYHLTGFLRFVQLLIIPFLAFAGRILRVVHTRPLSRAKRRFQEMNQEKNTPALRGANF